MSTEAHSNSSAAATRSRLSTVSNKPLLLKSPSATANAALTVLPTSSNSTMTDRDRVGLAGISDDQWEAIMKALNVTKPPPPSDPSDMSSTSTWILDTGASHHMTSKLFLLSNVRDINPIMVILADGTTRIAVHEGSVRLGPHLVLKSVFYVPELASDLISLGQLLDENHCLVQMTDKIIVIQDRNTKMVTGLGKRANGTFYFCGLAQAHAVQTQESGDFELWHSRMGHPSNKVLDAISGISVVSSLNKACDTCLRAKQTRNSFPISNTIATHIFEMVHCDVWGPYRTPSSSGARYFLTIVDDKSRSVWLFLMREKSETQYKLKEFIGFVERQFGVLIKTIRTDNGTEFMCLGSYLREKGIIHETSCVGTPNQNGRAERKHRHILNVARALRFHASLPIKFWGECILTAAHLINRTPSIVLDRKTPYEVLFGSAPSLNHLRVFGSLCYAHNQHTNGDKFLSRSRKCVFLGYPPHQKGWRLFDLDTKSFFVSRDVQFFETQFPFANAAGPDDFNSSPSSNEGPSFNIGLDDFSPLSHVISTSENNFDEFDGSSSSSSSAEPSSTSPMVDSPVSSPAGSTDESQPETSNSYSSVNLEEDNAPVVAAAPPPPIVAAAPPIVAAVPPPPIVADALPPPIIPEVRRGNRTKNPPSKLQDYVLNQVAVDPIASLPNSVTYPIHQFVSSHRFSAAHQAFQTQISLLSEPTGYKQAALDPLWNDAMIAEMAAQEENQTWTITDLPPNKKAIGSKWVYTLKFRSDGELERRKARLVALGNRQQEGEDYTETFAPVAKMDTIRVFLKYAAANHWIVHQMDVHNAFLHGDLSEEIYMKIPLGFQGTDPNKVCRLHKSLYGLKQAPRCWFAKLSSALLDYGFSHSYSDYSLFLYNKNHVSIRILIYVDDLIIAGSSEDAVAQFKSYLSTTFRMKDLGPLKYFLGIEVARNEDGFFLCQRKYALDLLNETGLLAAKPSMVPLPQHHQLALSTSAPISDPTSYRRLVGKLIYLANTRPDLAYSVHTLAQFMQSPGLDHWDAALKVLRYIKNSPGRGILINSSSDFSLVGWCDSDWATCPITRKSLSGYVVQLGGSPIAWKTKKQSRVSRSSAEAEYRAMALLTQELIWLKRLLHDFGFSHDTPMQILTDSKSAMALAANPIHHERTKHVGIDCHFIRDELVTGNIVTSYVSTSSQIADIFTKALGHRDLQAHNHKLGIIDLHAAPT